jgi:hypothetical protein
MSRTKPEYIAYAILVGGWVGGMIPGSTKLFNATVPQAWKRTNHSLAFVRG